MLAIPQTSGFRLSELSTAVHRITDGVSSKYNLFPARLARGNVRDHFGVLSFTSRRRRPQAERQTYNEMCAARALQCLEDFLNYAAAEGLDPYCRLLGARVAP